MGFILNVGMYIYVYRPDITLIEFEQIYDEYIQLGDNREDMLANETVFIHILNKSIFLNPDEKLAIVNGELTEYLAAMRHAATQD